MLLHTRSSRPVFVFVFTTVSEECARVSTINEADPVRHTEVYLNPLGSPEEKSSFSVMSQS